MAATLLGHQQRIAHPAGRLFPPAEQPVARWTHTSWVQAASGQHKQITQVHAAPTVQVAGAEEAHAA